MTTDQLLAAADVQARKLNAALKELKDAKKDVAKAESRQAAAEKALAALVPPKEARPAVARQSPAESDDAPPFAVPA